jgi:hypothetical protein
MPREQRPSLFQRVVVTRRVDDWVKRRKDEKLKKKNRNLIDDYLQTIGKKGVGELSLDRDGVCCFPFKKFVIVIEVAEENIDVCQFRTTVCPLGHRTNETEVIKTAVALHSNDIGEPIIMRKAKNGDFVRLKVPVHFDSLGRTLVDVKLDGVHMSCDIPIKGLKFETMAECLDVFLGTTLELNKQFQIAKMTPTKTVEPESQQKKTVVFPILKCAM